MNCPKCGANNPENTNQCLRCGTFFNNIQNNMQQQVTRPQEASVSPMQQGMQQNYQQGMMSQQGVANQQMMGNPQMGVANQQAQQGMQQNYQQGMMPQQGVANQQMMGNPQMGMPNQPMQQQMMTPQVNGQAMQTSSMPQLVNVQQATQQNINNLYANTAVANKNSKEIDQKSALTIYMGEKSNKIQAGNNLAAAGLGSIWFFYRKMPIHGIVVAILEALSFAISRGFAVPIAIFIVIRFIFLLFAANIFYTNKSLKKVEKMQQVYDNTDMTADTYRMQLKKAGGTSILMGLIGMIIFSTGYSLVHMIVPEKYYFKWETINVRAKGWVADGKNKIKYEDANGICYFEEYIYTESSIDTFLKDFEIREEDRTEDLKLAKIADKSYDMFEGSGKGNKFKIIEINDGGMYKSILLGYGKTAEESSACFKKVEKLIPEIELKDEGLWW